MPSINKINSDFNEVKRINFQDGATIDGPMITQILARLRNAETLIANTIAPPPSQITFIPYSNTTPISLALNDVLVFNSAQTVTSTDFLSPQNGTIYRFGNVSPGNVIIHDSTQIILTIVAGEFVKLIRFDNNWIRTFGP